MTAPTPTARLERVPFARPVRVTPLVGGQPSLRLLGGNLSRSGMFLRSPLLLEPGTKVSLSLEAKGQTLPFAEGEVIWQREPAKATDGVHPGFGIKFTQFLHPRSPELVDALVTRGMEKLQQPPTEGAAPAIAKTDVATGPQTPSKEQMEEFASPPPAFTELSLSDEAKEADEPAFLKGDKKLVLDLEKEPEGIPEVELEDELDLAPPTSLKPTIGRVFGTAGFMLLILVPLVVAIGTWKASKTAEPAVQELQQNETRVVEFAQPVVQPVAQPVQQQVVVAPVVDAEGEKLRGEKIEPAPLMDEKIEEKPTPVAVVAKMDGQIGKSQAVAHSPVVAAVANKSPSVIAKPLTVANKSAGGGKSPVVSAPIAGTKQVSASSLALELPSVSAVSAKSSSNELELGLQLGSNAMIRRAFALKSPDRLVIDVSGAAPKKSLTVDAAKLPGVKQLRVGAQPDGARLVFDLSKSAANVKVSGAHVTAELH